MDCIPYPSIQNTDRMCTSHIPSNILEKMKSWSSVQEPGQKLPTESEVKLMVELSSPVPCHRHSQNGRGMWSPSPHPPIPLTLKQGNHNPNRLSRDTTPVSMLCCSNVSVRTARTLSNFHAPQGPWHWACVYYISDMTPRARQVVTLVLVPWCH